MRLPLVLSLSALLLRCAPVEAQEACTPKRYVDGWLRSEGYALDGWGLQEGVLHELWLGPRGWAVTATDPRGCVSIVSLPGAPRERPGGRAG